MGQHVDLEAIAKAPQQVEEAEEPVSKAELTGPACEAPRAPSALQRGVTRAHALEQRWGGPFELLRNCESAT